MTDRAKRREATTFTLSTRVIKRLGDLQRLFPELSADQVITKCIYHLHKHHGLHLPPPPPPPEKVYRINGYEYHEDTIYTWEEYKKECSREFDTRKNNPDKDHKRWRRHNEYLKKMLNWLEERGGPRPREEK